MAITEVKKNIKFDTSKIEFICPVCKAKKFLDVPKSVIAEAKQLTTMSIANGLVCKHQFQAFVDKNFQVRGYQKVDFEIYNDVNHSKLRDSDFDDNELFKNLILEGNYVEYNLQQIQQNSNISLKNQENDSQKKNVSLQDIYNEFWEFIDENNEKFKIFIDNDLRRSQNPLYY